MFKFNPGKIAAPLALVLTLIVHPAAHAFDNIADKVFNFQMKMAESGQVQSQYKLGRMYETGHGTEKDMVQAMRWYQEASEKGYEPASDRITYQQVKDDGFDKGRHAAWLDSVKSRADANIPESVILLAQIYADGIAVRRNESKALQMLNRMSMEGMSEADADIAIIEERIERRKSTAVSKLSQAAS